MSAAETIYRPNSPTWPVWAALGVFATLALALVAIDLHVAHRVAKRIDDIVENAARSIDLVDDLRDEVRLLADRTVTPDEAEAARRRLAVDSREYDALAFYPGEAAEWHKLKSRLAVIAQPGAQISRAELRDVSDAVDRLVELNRNSARANERVIAATNRSAVVADATVGGVSLLLAAAIGVWLLRVLQRQRALVAQHIALLDARNRELDAFAARAAHDLRVPLNPLRGYADLLATGQEPPDEVRHMAERIRIAVQRMSRTIDDMLELSRTSTLRDAETAVLSAVVADVLDERRSDLADADVHVAVGDDVVRGSGGVVALILRNLIGNAIKFRGRDRRLRLSLESRRVDGAIEIVVADNGVGMDSEAVRHAFESGYRGRADREVPGHGLGLAIVDRATRAIGGKREIVSAPDQGTTVTIRLPGATARGNPSR